MKKIIETFKTKEDNYIELFEENNNYIVIFYNNHCNIWTENTIFSKDLTNAYKWYFNLITFFIHLEFFNK